MWIVAWVLVSFRQDMVCEDPQFMMNMICSLDNKLNDDESPGEASHLTFPLLGLPDQQVAQSQQAKCDDWQQKPIFLMRYQGKYEDIKYCTIHNFR